ncbi:MAG TPA: hypothetical protein VHC73_14750 [Vitreimonas sp.]|jgi:hypothetical protein|nr:hypothetical protein [Vitreimonas sp.]
MATALNEEHVTLTGRSGAQHTFAIWHRDTRFQARGGVYIMARLETFPEFTMIYIGETADLSKRPFVKERVPCFNQHRVDRIFTLDEQDAAKRKAIADDLLQAIMPVCNQL